MKRVVWRAGGTVLIASLLQLTALPFADVRDAGAATGDISTMAGTGTYGHTGDGGPATAAQINFATGTTVDALGNTIIAGDDATNGTYYVRKVSPSGTISTLAGTGTAGFSGDGGPATAAQLDKPSALASDAAGNIYVADIGNHRVRKVSTTGVITTVAGNGALPCGPGAPECSDQNGEGGPATQAPISNPAGIAVDRIGNIFISDSTCANVRFVDTAGNIHTLVGKPVDPWGCYNPPSPLALPKEIAVDDAGNLYISDGYRVRRWSGGVLSIYAGSGPEKLGTSGFAGDGGPATSALLQQTRGLALDGSGALFISTLTRVRKVDRNGIITTVAGNGTGSYGGDGGPATQAYIRSPGVAVDLAGNLNLADGSNARVRQVAGITVPRPAGLSAGEQYGGCNPAAPCFKTALKSISTFTDWPVDAATGNFWHTFPLVAIPGRGPGLDFSLTYNSLAAGTPGRFGNGWQDSYATSLAIVGGGSSVTVNQENGAQVTFTLLNGVYIAPLRVQASLTHNGDGTWTFVRRQRDTFTFDASGNLTRIADLNGYQTNLTYSAGQLTTVTDPAGRTLTFGYTAGKVTTVSDTAGLRSLGFGYTGSDLTSITDVGGGVTTMSYDGNHQMLQMLDPNQQSAPVKHYLTNVYDPTTSKVTSQTDFAGRTTSFDYTSIPGSTRVTDPKGNVTVEQFSGGLPTAITRAYGTGSAATWTQSFDGNTFLPVCAVAPDGLRTYLTYDARGNQLSSTVGATICDPSNIAGRKTSRTYDAFNDVLTMTDAKNVVTTYTYDGQANLQSVSTPIDTHPGSNLAVSYTYDPAHAGDVQTMTDPHGKVWTYGYDTYGLRSTVTDPNGKITQSCYDTVGRRQRLITPKGVSAGVTCVSANPTYTTVYTTNAYGDLLTATDALGQQTVQTYWPDRTLKTVKDPKLQTTTYNYDLENELIQVDRPDLTAVKTDYWPDGSLKSQTDGANQATSYAYDPLGHLTTVTDPLGRVTTYTYDAVGNLRTRQDPGGSCTAPVSRCTTYTPTTYRELQSIAYSDGTTPNVSYTYDNDGQRLTMVDGTGNSSWSWDSVHRLTSSGDGAGQTTAYDYDLAARQETVTYPGNKTVTRHFDLAGRPDSTTDWSTHQTSYSYDDNSNQTGQTNGDTTTAVQTPDAADRLMGITHKLGAATLADFTYTRDNNDLLSGVTSTGVGSNETYQHNTLNQVSQVNANTYTYDAADNLTKHADGTLQRYDVANQLCYASPTSSAAACGSTPPTDATLFAYDTLGNRTTTTPASGGQTAYGYDQGNRLKTASVPYESANLGQFTPLAPKRVLDTRNPSTGTCYQPNNTSVSCQSTLTANTTRYFQVAGFAGSGVPASGINAVAFSVTAWTPGSAGNLSVFASDASTPTTQLLTFPASGTTTNGLIAKLGADGRLAIRSTVATNVEVDVVGYYATSSGTRGGVYAPVTPTQLATGTLTSAASTNIQVTGNAGIPATTAPGGVSSVVVQLNVTATTAVGFAEVWDTGSTRNGQTRKLSFLNADNQTTMVVSKLSNSGQMSLYAGGSGFTYTIRVLGYYTATPIASGALNVVQTPTRLLKTGTSPIGSCTPSCATLAGNGQLSVQATGAAGIPATGVKAVTVAVTGVNVTGSTAGNVAVGNTSGTPNPTAQFAAAETISNSAIVPVDADGKIVVKNNTSANRDVIIDVVGWQEQATKTWTYTYNGDGLRTKKTAPDGNITTYTWDQSGGLPMLIAETTGANTTRYIYGPDSMPIEDVQPDGTSRYYHHDQIGSTRALTNQAGTIVGTTTYNAYGKLTTSTGAATTPLGYAGEYTDTETGLQYLRARYYEPATGQFLTRDPLSTVTRSPYGYASDRPFSATDPSGLLGWDDVEDAWDSVESGLGEAADFAYRNRDTIASGVAIAACIGTVGTGCVVATTIAVAVRGWKRFETYGVNRSTVEIAIFDAGISFGTLGLVKVPAQYGSALVEGKLGQLAIRVGLPGGLGLLGFLARGELESRIRVDDC